MTYSINLVPAYGRDYQTPEAVLKDWIAGKDFKIADIGSRWDGKYTSNSDWNGQAVRIRFNRLADFTILRGSEIVGSSRDDEEEAECDSCGKVAKLTRVIAYGIETNACDECRGQS